MIASPTTWLDKAGQLANQRGTDNYRAAADILADMREAIGTEEGDKITRNYAADLARKYPTLKMLSSSLRKRGLLDLSSAQFCLHQIPNWLRKAGR